MRPAQQLHFVVLYRLFGTDPVGYHVMNGLVLLGGVLLLHRVLLRVGLPRLPSVAVPLVFALLPHYSTDRFWMIASGIPLSLFLYLVSVYSDLRALRVAGTRYAGWRTLGLVSLLISALTYELFLPLFFLNVLLYQPWAGLRRTSPEGATQPALVLLPANLVALASVVVFKVLTTARLGTQRADLSALQQALRIGRILFDPDHGEADYGLNLKQAVWVNYGELGVLLPRMAWRAILDHSDRLVLPATAVLVGTIVFVYLCRLARREEFGEASRAGMLGLAAGGIVVFWAGYSIFLTSTDLQLTATGVGNRTALAPALGVALTFVGAAGWVSSWAPGAWWARRSFCLLISLLCSSGLLINGALATLWSGAYRQESEVLAALRHDLPTLQPASTLILDGVCPYLGPAIVFEASWDLAGALQLFYRDVSLQADVVTTRMRIEEDGLATSIYGMESRYPYEQILLFDYARRSSHRLRDAGEAREHFRTRNPDLGNGCPPGHEGVGAAAF